MGRKLYYMNGEEIPIVGGDPDAAKAALTGKVLIAIGDSYTNLMGTQLNALCSKYGLILDKRAESGSAIRHTTNPYHEPLVDKVDRMIQSYTDSGFTSGGITYTKDDVAVITFMGGWNDGPSAGVIGTGINDTAITTVYGAVHHILYTLLKEFTKAKVICLTQPTNYSLSAASVVTTEAAAAALGFDSVAQAQLLDDMQFSSYCSARTQAAVRNVAVMYGCELIDMLYEMPPISNPANKSAYWRDPQTDKIHPSNAGLQLIANAIEKKLLDLFW